MQVFSLIESSAEKENAVVQPFVPVARLLPSAGKIRISNQFRVALWAPQGHVVASPALNLGGGTEKPFNRNHFKHRFCCCGPQSRSDRQSYLSYLRLKMIVYIHGFV